MQISVKRMVHGPDYHHHCYDGLLSPLPPSTLEVGVSPWLFKESCALDGEELEINEVEMNKMSTLDPEGISVAQVGFSGLVLVEVGGRVTLRYHFGSYNLVG